MTVRTLEAAGACQHAMRQHHVLPLLASWPEAALAATSARAAQLTRARMQVLREAIVAHAGYEINTEGDSFHIAFASVHQVRT